MNCIAGSRTGANMVCSLVVAGLLVCASSAVAVEETFWVEVDAAGDVIAGGGSGYNGGQWYYYEDSGWWRQWFYCGDYDQAKWCEIEYFVPVCRYDQEQAGWAEMTYGWTAAGYSQAQPPLPPLTGEDEDAFIVHAEPTWQQECKQGRVTGRSDSVSTPYQPQWLSWSVRGYNFDLTNLGGGMEHQSVPEPASALLLLLGSGGMLRARRKR